MGEAVALVMLDVTLVDALDGEVATTCPVPAAGADALPLSVIVEPWLVCVGKLVTADGAVFVPVAVEVVPCVVPCETVLVGVACDAEPVPNVIVALI